MNSINYRPPRPDSPGMFETALLACVVVVIMACGIGVGYIVVMFIQSFLGGIQ